MKKLEARSMYSVTVFQQLGELRDRASYGERRRQDAPFLPAILLRRGQLPPVHKGHSLEYGERYGASNAVRRHRDNTLQTF